MNLALVKQILSEPWAMFMVVFFFGASIFVHELGHFLAARWRKLKIERFSIGMGPRLFGWKGKDGVDYRVSLLPIGGYVALPQLADMQGIEGENDYDSAELPPISYADKMYVSVAGAVFNVIFALFLASILWFTGIPQDSASLTRELGVVAKEQTLFDGQVVESAAYKAGLQPGDEILEIDGAQLRQFSDIIQLIATGTEKDIVGNPMSRLKILRDGEELELSVYPNIVSDEKIRNLGYLAPKQDSFVGALIPGFPAEAAGLAVGDEILSVNGEALRSAGDLSLYIEENPEEEFVISVKRGEEILEFSLKAQKQEGEGGRMLIGIQWMQRMELVKVDPFTQIKESFLMTFRVLKALLHPDSNIGVRNLSGPIGISYAIFLTSIMSFSMLLSLIVLINVNLAFLNLLPIPVLDGGHMAFATVQKLTGRKIPEKFIAGAQGVFMILLFGMMLYVTFFDIGRVSESEKQRLEMNQRVEEAQAAEENSVEVEEVNEATGAGSK